VKGSISKLGLRTRVENHLRYEGIKTIQALLKRTPYEILLWRGFGLQMMHDLRDGLAKHGLKLKDDPGMHAIYLWYVEREKG
jgi:DNA-directed RNA polymerase alpha subunit